MICLEGDEPPIDAVMISAKDSQSRIFFWLVFMALKLMALFQCNKEWGSKNEKLKFFPSLCADFFLFGQKNHKSDNKKRMLMIIRALKVFSLFFFGKCGRRVKRHVCDLKMIFHHSAFIFICFLCDCFHTFQQIFELNLLECVWFSIIALPLIITSLSAPPSVVHYNA